MRPRGAADGYRGLPVRVRPSAPSQGHSSGARARGRGPRGRRCDLRLSLPRRAPCSSRTPSHKGIAQEPERAVRDREAVGAIPTTLTTSRRSSTGQSTSVLHSSSPATSRGRRVVVGWFSSSQRKVAGSNPAVCSKARTPREWARFFAGCSSAARARGLGP